MYRGELEGKRGNVGYCVMGSLGIVCVGVSFSGPFEGGFGGLEMMMLELGGAVGNIVSHVRASSRREMAEKQRGYYAFSTTTIITADRGCVGFRL